MRFAGFERATSAPFLVSVPVLKVLVNVQGKA
jgi:hypothetical protein